MLKFGKNSIFLILSDFSSFWNYSIKFKKSFLKSNIYISLIFNILCGFLLFID